MKIRSKATLTLRAMLARRYGFGASPNKPPLCHLWPQRHTIENEKNQRKCHTRRIFCYENGKRVANRQNDLQLFSYYYVLCSRGNCPPEVIFSVALYH